MVDTVFVFLHYPGHVIGFAKKQIFDGDFVTDGGRLRKIAKPDALAYANFTRVGLDFPCKDF
jgi:hypothetical protein